jgi:RNA polymerase sigma-70 factor, ECF subfamily
VGATDHGQAPPGDVHARVAEVFRLEYARVVASVLRLVRDIDAAEDVVQEAFAQALDRWPGSGLPDRPGAWLVTTARRRAVDRLRGARRADRRADAIA